MQKIKSQLLNEAVDRLVKEFAPKKNNFVRTPISSRSYREHATGAGNLPRGAVIFDAKNFGKGGG